MFHFTFILLTAIHLAKSSTSGPLSSISETSDITSGEYSINGISYHFMSNVLSDAGIRAVKFSRKSDGYGFACSYDSTNEIYSLSLGDLNSKQSVELSSTSNDGEATDAEILVFESILSDGIFSDFVSFSMDLAQSGRLDGENSNPTVQQIHNLASSFYRMITQDENISKDNFVDFSSKIEETNDIVSSQNNMRRLLSIRNLLHGCSLSNTCGNSYFGRCGPDSTCWSWLCGTCGCVLECKCHDDYCSCGSMFNFWCVNVFWVGCGHDHQLCYSMYV